MTGLFGAPGTVYAGFTDVTGLFGAPGTIYAGALVTGRFAFDTSDWVNQNGFWDAGGAPTPGYSVSVTLNGVTVAQPDVSSYFGPYIENGGFGLYFGGWDNLFYLEVTADAATTAALGLTQANVDTAIFPGFTLNASQLQARFNRFVIGDGAGGEVGIFSNIQLTDFSIAPTIPEPATWGMMLIGFGAMGVALRHRRATALQTA